MVSGGTASFSTATLSVGGHTITASYSGDGNFAASTSSSLDETVDAAPVTGAADGGAPDASDSGAFDGGDGGAFDGGDGGVLDAGESPASAGATSGCGCRVESAASGTSADVIAGVALAGFGVARRRRRLRR